MGMGIIKLQWNAYPHNFFSVKVFTKMADFKDKLGFFSQSRVNKGCPTVAESGIFNQIRHGEVN
jgi:hypothetical protein